MLVNLLRTIDVNIKITGIVIFCIISALIVIPAMAELKYNLGNLAVNSFSETQSYHSKSLEQNTINRDVYIPPNYGAPDTQFGSGTR